ncbi:MAG TPA: pepsin-like aspartic protease [Kofleriaceae bacterium]|jgi:hypothetical protein
MSSLKMWIASGIVASLFAACGNSNNGDNTTDANNGSGSGSGSGNGSGSGSGSGSGTSPDGTGHYALTAPDGVAWDAMVTVGGQPFAMDVDTGSTTLGVVGGSCSTCTGISPTYSPSSSATDTGSATEADYGQGSWDGEIYSDKVAMGGDSSSYAMDFADITSQTEFFQDNSEQGIIGMGPADLALTGTDAYLDKRGANTIAFQLCPSDGSLWIDTTDSSSMSGSFQYEPMIAFNDQTGAGAYWEVQVTSGSLGTKGKLSGAAVLDTGTTLIISSTTTAKNMLADMNGSTGYQTVFGSQKATLLNTQNPTCVTPTTTMTSAQIDAILPPLTVQLSTITLTLPATQSYLMYSQGEYCFSVYPDDSLTQGGLGMILGDAFLRYFVVQFDMQNRKAGFAPQVGCQLPEAHPDPRKPFVMPNWRHPDRIARLRR